ncbi:AAA family ATPase [Oceanobacillus alkalisoli]|uniref:AAA family ATPase n=1 Tax=Oceanobacillus alkalisoli TaxID=2925113 RepID=UPI001F11C5FC|nr:AAA family ATPase [Oceanobacillus alkalisoli]MCF3944851.1 AAA family ATPase [Oceanobacillus alkalisoli]
MGYKIKEIYIKNFKSIEKCYLDLKDKDLTVLDGPNGFGKTSIFDAIELVLTGEIRRIANIKITDGNKGYDDYLFAKNQYNPIIIKIKLNKEDSQESKIIGRKINHIELTRIKKRPDVFPSTIHLLNNIDEKLTKDNEIESVEEILGLEDFQNAYGLYNYIEQEESAHFLKRNEDDRMKMISKLFNIEKEENERTKLVKAKNKMSRNLGSMDTEIKQLEKNLDFNTVNKKQDKVEYFRLLPQTVSKKETWDQLDVKPLDLNQKDVYFNRIDAFEYLIRNIDSFKAMYFNESVNALINNDERIKDALLLYHFYEKMEEFRKEHELKKKLNNYLTLIEQRDILNQNINWNVLHKYFDFPITLEGLKDKLTIIRNLNKNSNQLSTMITSLLNTREQLKNNFERLIMAQEVPNDSCPLCGKEWEDNVELTNQISIQTKLFQEKQDEASNEASKLINELYTNVMDKLIEDIKTFTINLIDSEKYEILRSRFEKGFNKTKAKEFFDSLSINIEEIAYSELKTFDDLPTRIELVREKLRESLKSTGDFDFEKYDELKDIYNNTFEKNDELLAEVDVTKFNLKKAYLNYLYFLQSNLQYQKYNDLKEKYKVIKKAFDAIDRAIQIYNNKIENYRSKMIKEIEIPFFIYTGKIIQNYQRGIGVFIHEQIKEGKESKIKAIRFVPPQKTDHDIVHSFSSGQLTATVLAFTLALNKVYNNSGINTLLIDDPVQTMDEMNMASFVELLRNDFERQQIILSTHDNQVSLYIRYKFSKYGYRTTQINVKEHFYK